MPMVGMKKFAYTSKGKKMAEMEANKTGKKVVKKTAVKKMGKKK